MISPLGMRSFQQRPRRSKNRNAEAYAAAKSYRQLVQAQRNLMPLKISRRAKKNEIPPPKIFPPDEVNEH
jgi:hypothetical protein